MATKGIRRVKFVQLNIWQGRLLRGQTLNYVQLIGADILCMQEVFSCKQPLKNIELFDSLEQILSVTDFPYCFFAPTVSFDVQGAEVMMGNAILSRYPLSEQETVFVSEEFAKLDIRSEPEGNRRAALLCTADTPAGPLSVSTLHGYWAPDGAVGNESSVQSMNKWIEALRARRQPLIACGDLNVHAKSKAMQGFKGFLTNLTETHNLKTTLTQLGVVENVACDHILVSDDINVRNFYVDDVLVSDHFPLIMEFDL